MRATHRIGAAFVAVLITLTAVAQPASAGTIIRGRILATYSTAGGEAAFGAPVEAEVKLVLSGRNVYRQRFEAGIVFWSSYVGGRTATYPATLGLSGVSNERDALASSGFAPGMVFRSAKLCGATAKDRQLMLAQLAGGTIIDLRTSGAASSCPDPSLTGVTKVRYSINSDADHARYVTDSARRASFGKALRLIAATSGPVWIHCTAGKDRTGWTIAMLMYALGADTATVRAEYMRTPGAYASRLDAGLKAIAIRYGTVDAYLRDGLGLDEATLAKLRSRLG